MLDSSKKDSPFGERWHALAAYFPRYIAAVSRAQRSQVNLSTRPVPRALSLFRTPSSVHIVSSPFARSSLSSGSTRNAAEPAISPIEEPLDVRTGVPTANASVIGSPNPSWKDG